MFDILLQAESFVKEFIRVSLPTSRCFHTFRHTRSVVDAAEQLAEAFQLPWAEAEALFVAAWFHATGYARNDVDYINQSIRIARYYLDNVGSPDDFKILVSSLIRSTAIGVDPCSLSERILKDAIGYYLGSPHYFICSQLRRQEIEWSEEIKYSDQEWVTINARSLEDHQYHTVFAAQCWGEQKRKNLKMLIDLVDH